MNKLIPVSNKVNTKRELSLNDKVTINHETKMVKEWIDDNYRLFEVWKDNHFLKMNTVTLIYLIRVRNNALQKSVYKPYNTVEVCDILLSLST